eukprot:CAMPEP_0197259574 /NCGR_PEP_ID=MMETSP1429-20130617/83580_1 /TAXON_ID=49237 /ORGANISM="Chaetoceros  sp., Strain UNC1202" /LENGTH=562 /DNA_ID=CAMNT_0042723783 /DNA_START=36 /DNA_END=1724 /DNA_ORIENTATION=+
MTRPAAEDTPLMATLSPSQGCNVEHHGDTASDEVQDIGHTRLSKFRILLAMALVAGAAVAGFTRGLTVETADMIPDQSNLDTEYVYTPDAQKDMITNLPGLTFELTFKQFSGYIQVSGGEHLRKLHYWYIESSGNPSTDPVVFWTNGGPGCSGLLGLGIEFGPYFFEKDGSLTPNPHTWNQVANILYVEQPAGVGFSTYKKPSDGNMGEKRAAVDNFQLITQFFERFPERKSNEFYIASESFGGHYMPNLALEILDHNDGSINFRGFAVGNPYVDPYSKDITQMQAYYSHGLFPQPEFTKWEKNCMGPDAYLTDECQHLEEKLYSYPGEGINFYGLDYPMCTEANPDHWPQLARRSLTATAQIDIASASVQPRRRAALSSQARHLMQHTSRSSPPFLPKEDNYQPCAEAHLHFYLNRDDVKEALHVDLERHWSACNPDVKYSLEDVFTPQIHRYAELIARAKKNGSNFKMMVYSGDDDSVCSTRSTQYWIYNVGASYHEDKLWKTWTFNNQTAGFLTEFDLGDTDSSFIFVTVHGGGHELPAYRPAEALSMFKSYFSGEWDV